MANRHLSRTIALQSLFEWDFNGRQDEIKTIAQKHIKEFSGANEETDFIFELAEGVAKNLPAIDEIVVKLAPEWPIAQIPPDRNRTRDPRRKPGNSFASEPRAEMWDPATRSTHAARKSQSPPRV